MSKYNILFVCHDFPPYKYAGAQLYAMNLALAINKTGLANVEIFHPVFRPGDLEYPSGTLVTASFNGLKVHKLYKSAQNYNPDNLQNELVANSFNSLLMQNKYDLVHIHGLGQLSAVPIEIAKKNEIKTIMTICDSWLICEEWHLIDPSQNICSGPESINKCANCYIKHYTHGTVTQDFIAAIQKYKDLRHKYNLQMFKLLDARVVRSKFLKNVFNSFGFNDIQIIPSGFTPQKVYTKKINNKFVFGYAGRVTKVKGLNHLIKAFQKIPQEQAELHIYGGSDDNLYLDSILTKASTANNIKYFGPYHPDQLPKIFSTFDITVIPSLMESYSRLVRESFMSKTPVIASDAGAIPEAVRDGVDGLVFQAGDVHGLYNCLNCVLNDSSLLSNLTKNIKPVRSIEQDVIDYLKLYNLKELKLIKQNSIDRKKKKVLLYYFKNVHIPILKPIKDKLIELKDTVDLAISCMQYSPDIRAGFTPKEFEIIKSYNIPIYNIPQDFNPDITIIADSVYPWVQNCGKLIHIGHGILSKGQYYTDTEIAKREEHADIVCVPGEYHASILRKIISKPVIITGMAKLDALYNGTYQKEILLRQMNLPLDCKYILFAPTFNDELSTIPFVMNRINDIITDDKTILLIKLHGSTNQVYKNMYIELAKNDNRVIYIEDLDLAPYITIADIMITDVSSAMFEFASLDKPVVLFNNPNWYKYANFNPNDIEYTFRGIGFQTNSLFEIKNAINELIAGNDPHKGIRLSTCKQLINNINYADATDNICSIVMKT